MPEPLIKVSDLREFAFCERSWSLAPQGFSISPQARAQRQAGTEFHAQRAADAVKGDNPRALRWIVILLALAAALVLLYFFQRAHS